MDREHKPPQTSFGGNVLGVRDKAFWGGLKDGDGDSGIGIGDIMGDGKDKGGEGVGVLGVGIGEGGGESIGVCMEGVDSLRTEDGNAGLGAALGGASRSMIFGESTVAGSDSTESASLIGESISMSGLDGDQGKKFEQLHLPPEILTFPHPVEGCSLCKVNMYMYRKEEHRGWRGGGRSYKQNPQKPDPILTGHRPTSCCQTEHSLEEETSRLARSATLTLLTTSLQSHHHPLRLQQRFS